MHRVRLERRCRLLRLAGVPPQDRCAAFGRDHRVDRVLLHEHPVGDGDRDRPAGATLADDARDRRDPETNHRKLGAGNPAALAMLLGLDARICARRVDERDHRETVPVRELHDPHRLPIALGVGHPEVPVRSLPDVTTFLVPDERDRPAVEPPEPGNDGRVVRERTVTVQLDEVVEHPLDVVERVGPVLMPRELDRPPDLVARRARLRSARSAAPASQARPRRRHRAGAGGPAAASAAHAGGAARLSPAFGSAAMVEERQEAAEVGPEIRRGRRSRRRGRSARSTRPARSSREASPGSFAGRHAGR